MLTRRPWEFGLGSWGGVDVRAHVSWPLFIIAAMYWGAFLADASNARPPVVQNVAIALLVLVVSSVIHVAIQVFSASKRGVTVREVVLAPWGEWEPLPMPLRVHDLLRVAGDGIAFHFIVAFAAIGAFFAVVGYSEQSIYAQLFDLSRILEGRPILVFVRIVFWVNFALLLINATPVYPFDGEFLFRAFVRTTQAKWAVAYREAMVVSIGWVVAAVLGLVALVIAYQVKESHLPAIFAVWATFSAYGAWYSQSWIRDGRETDDEDMLPVAAGEPNYEGSAELKTHDVVQLAQSGESRDRTIRFDDNAQLDEVLAKLHDRGIASLTAAERALLDRMSARFRKRKT